MTAHRPIITKDVAEVVAQATQIFGAKAANLAKTLLSTAEQIALYKRIIDAQAQMAQTVAVQNDQLKQNKKQGPAVQPSNRPRMGS